MADVNYKIGADASAVVQEIGKVRKSLAGLGKLNWANLAMGVQAVMGHLNTLKNISVGAFNALVKPAAEVEKYLVRFETMLGTGEKANEYMAKLREYAASTPFELSEIADAAGVLLSFGTAADKSNVVLRQLGDVAAVTGASLKDLAMIYGKVAAVGFDTESVNQLAQRSVNVRALLAARDGLTAAEVQKRISAKQYGIDDLDYVLATTTGAGGIHHGGTAKSAATLDGALSTLRDSLNDVAVVIGDKFAPVIKSLAHDITQALPSVQKWVENFIPIIKAPELLAADVAEPWEFQRMRDLAAGYRPDEAPAVNEAVAKKLNDDLRKQRQSAAAARNAAAFGKLSAGAQAQEVQAALRALGYKGSIQNAAKVDKFLTDVQKSAADAGDESTFKRAAYQRDRYATLQKTSASAEEARRQAHNELARRHIVEGGNSMQLARFDATQSAYAMAQQYMAAGMGQQEATRLAATQAAKDMQMSELPAAHSATIAQSRVAVGGGGTSIRLGDAQLDVARRHLNIAEETKRVMDNISAMLQQRTGSAIPVTL